MNKHILRPGPILPEAEIAPDPFAPVSRSKTVEHEKRFQANKISQNFLKNEENES